MPVNCFISDTHRGVALLWVRFRRRPKRGHPFGCPLDATLLATGIDLHFSSPCSGKKNYCSHQCLHWWQRHPTGVSLCYGFDSGADQKEDTLSGVLFLVPATGIEPVRFLRRGILSPLCLPIPPCRHRFVIVAYFYIFVKEKAVAIPENLWVYYCCFDALFPPFFRHRPVIFPGRKQLVPGEKTSVCAQKTKQNRKIVGKEP